MAEEIRRTVPFIEAVRAAYPDLVISVDTWRHEVGRAVCEAGADLLNDTWSGWDPEAGRGRGGVRRRAWCARTRAACCPGPGRSAPPTPTSWRTSWTAHWPWPSGRCRPGSTRDRILIDPAHDFGKNTWHSLEVSRRLAEMTATGWPVLVSVSNKDFVGETLGAAIEDRLAGTLAVTSVARLARGQGVPGPPRAETRQALDMVAAIKGDLTPAGIIRGLT